MILKEKAMFDSMYVELTSLCNMDCDFCVSRVMNRPKSHMDFDRFTDIIDQIVASNLTNYIQLAAIGESLLYPRLIEAVKYCKEKKLETSIITNGLLLTKGLYQSLADAGLGEAQISFHSLTPKSFDYRRARPSIDHHSFFQNMIRLVDYHVSHKIPTRLVINLMFCKEEWISSQLWDLPAIKEDTKNADVLLRPFIDEMDKIAKRNKIKCRLNRNISRHLIRTLNIFSYRLFRIMDNVYLKVNSLNPQKFNTRKKLDDSFSGSIRMINRKRGVCYFLNSPMVLANGSFIPCCVDGLEELVMGRVDAERPLVSIIEGERYQNLLNGFKNKSVISPVCQECMGRLEYKDRYLRIGHLINKFDLYAYMYSIFYSGKQFLRRVWRDNLSEKYSNAKPFVNISKTK